MRRITNIKKAKKRGHDEDHRDQQARREREQKRRRLEEDLDPIIDPTTTSFEELDRLEKEIEEKKRERLGEDGGCGRGGGCGAGGGASSSSRAIMAPGGAAPKTAANVGQVTSNFGKTFSAFGGGSLGSTSAAKNRTKSPAHDPQPRSLRSLSDDSQKLAMIFGGCSQSVFSTPPGGHCKSEKNDSRLIQHYQAKMRTGLDRWGENCRVGETITSYIGGASSSSATAANKRAGRKTLGFVPMHFFAIGMSMSWTTSSCWIHRWQ